MSKGLPGGKRKKKGASSGGALKWLRQAPEAERLPAQQELREFKTHLSLQPRTARVYGRHRSGCFHCYCTDSGIHMDSSAITASAKQNNSRLRHPTIDETTNRYRLTKLEHFVYFHRRVGLWESGPHWSLMRRVSRQQRERVHQRTFSYCPSQFLHIDYR